MSKIAIIGCGAWGTCFAKICADAGNEVLVWTREEDVVEEINSNHTNRAYLKSVLLPEEIRATENPEDISWGEIVISALPCQSLRSALPAFAPVLEPLDAPVVSLSKGMEKGSGKLPTQVIEECLHVPSERVFALGGPNLAALLAKEELAAAQVAGTNKRAADLAKTFSNPYYFVSASSDPIGLQVWGALKNVAAIACGMAAGAGYGENTAAVLISAALSEIEALSLKLGGKAETMEGPAGVGDLVCTASSQLSRNFSLGYRMGLGINVEEAARGVKGVTEGKDTIDSALALSKKYDSPMPLAGALKEAMEGKTDFAALFSKVAGETA
ncbi:MAG: NAD(P)H-dependent glycerol-3-phosphate dehydrogenase [Aeriscardovia sp.]|nr:NAD(P)H-dependent glycerol-3-phosphate dehydrogenase [Aeriscardovia sp.]